MMAATYLAKVLFFSGLMVLYYFIALRNRPFHIWNRFYLLATVVISLTAPFLQVMVTQQVNTTSDKSVKLLKVVESANDYLEEVTLYSHQPASSGQWTALAYWIISLIILISLLYSVFKIVSIIRSHKVEKQQNICLITTDHPGTPFSFFHFIFWNNKIDLHSETGQQIFQHELVHVRERHTIDKLFLQLILIFFWFNPFFWLVRKELNMVHEFLADKKAVAGNGPSAFAAMILQSIAPQSFHAITNPFFQSSIKRRLTMITKIQNIKNSHLTRVLAVPIAITGLLAFTIKPQKKYVSDLHLVKDITVVIDAGHGLIEGKHSGAAYQEFNEDDIVLSLAKRIQSLNQNEKVHIVLSRPSEKIVELHDRVTVASDHHADLFLSLHMNYTDNKEPASTTGEKTTSGMEVCLSGKLPSYLPQSEVFGSLLQQELSTVYTTLPYLTKVKSGVWVLDHNACPSVLIECGYINNKKDRDFISDRTNQDLLAGKILKAIERYASSQ